MTVKINRAGMQELEDRLTAGLNQIADAVYDVAYATAPVETKRDPAYTKEELHVDRRLAGAWPNAVVFVNTGSGDGFYVHEGTNDTPAQPFLAQAVDAVSWQFAGLMKAGSKRPPTGIRSHFVKLD